MCGQIRPQPLPPPSSFHQLLPQFFQPGNSKGTQLGILFSSCGIQWSGEGSAGGIWKDLCQYLIRAGKCPLEYPSRSPVLFLSLGRTNGGLDLTVHI